jgi:hypothetical protein
MRLAVLALCAFCELFDSISYVSSMELESPNPTLTASLTAWPFKIN